MSINFVIDNMAQAQGDGKDSPGTPFLMASPHTSGGLADLDDLSRLHDGNVTVRQNQQTNDPPSPRILEMPSPSSEPKPTPLTHVVLGTQERQQQ